MDFTLGSGCEASFEKVFFGQADVDVEVQRRVQPIEWSPDRAAYDRELNVSWLEEQRRIDPDKVPTNFAAATRVYAAHKESEAIRARAVEALDAAGFNGQLIMGLFGTMATTIAATASAVFKIVRARRKSRPSPATLRELPLHADADARPQASLRRRPLTMANPAAYASLTRSIPSAADSTFVRSSLRGRELQAGHRFSVCEADLELLPPPPPIPPARPQYTYANRDRV
jgi:hypothetical protein